MPDGVDQRERMIPAPTGERGAGGSPVAARVVLVTCIGLAATAALLWIVAHPPWDAFRWYTVVDITDALVYGVVAWLLLRRCRHPVAWILAVTAVGGGLAGVGAGWASMVLDRPDLPPLGVIRWLESATWIPGTLALIVILPWLVRERLRPLGWFTTAAVIAGALLIAWMMLGRLTDPFPWPFEDSMAPFAVHSQWWSDTVDGWSQAQWTLACVLGAVAVGDVVRRWLVLPDEQRRGLGWLAVATALMTVSFLPLALPEDAVERFPVEFTAVSHLLSQAFLPAAVLVVVLRQRMWGIEMAVSRAVLWSLLTMLVIVATVTVVTVTDAIVPARPGLQQVVATSVVVAGFLPLRGWLQIRVDRLVRGDVTQPSVLALRVGREFGSASDDDELIDSLTNLVHRSLRLGAIVVDDPDGGRLAMAGDSAPAGAPVERQLVHQQAVVGSLVAWPRPGERLDAATLVSLDDLTPLLAAAVHLASTARALAESRERIVAVRDEERRVLRRELHDGLGPALAGVGLGLRAGRNLLDADPDAAAELLDRLAVELDARVDDVRDLARGLVPPALDDQGLIQALHEIAGRYRANGLAVSVSATDGLVDLDPAVGAAAYGIASEAVRNVHRHAAATGCAVCVTHGADLVLSVTDDGVGLDPCARRGVGLTSMREWAEGVGGTVDVSAIEPRGTRVEARFPLGAGGRS